MLSLIKSIFGKPGKSIISSGSVRPYPGINSEIESASFPCFQGEAIVAETIYPCHCGRVRFNGSYWFAKCRTKVTLLEGAIVQVVGVNNITLIVEPEITDTEN